MHPEMEKRTLALMATVSALGFSLGLALAAPAAAEPDKPKPKPGDEQALTAGRDDQASLASQGAVDSRGQANLGGGPHREASGAKAKAAASPAMSKLQYDACCAGKRPAEAPSGAMAQVNGQTSSKKIIQGGESNPPK